MEQTILQFAKRFAQNGYFVFPLYSSSKGPQKPFGWARNSVEPDIDPKKVIPATNDVDVIDAWPQMIRDGYSGAHIVAYGVMGIGRIIFDLDVKDGKDGMSEFIRLKRSFDIPPASFAVKTKSGGYHLYYDKPDQLKSLAIKSVAGANISGQKYSGVDVRGDGGMVIGPVCEGSEDDWSHGQYQIIRGGPESELTKTPIAVALALSKNHIRNDASDIRPVYQESTDELEILKRGEIPAKLSNGNRNNGYYLYLNALKNKGISAESARRYVQELIKVTENSETLSDSVDIEDMISRIWRVDSNNPYDVCLDLIGRGLYRLTAYKSRLHYVILDENPYLDSRSPHEISSMKQLLSRFARKMANAEGKVKVVNPADLIDSNIGPDREVSTVAFKPGASEVFTLTEAPGGRRYLNTWQDPRPLAVRSNIDVRWWAMFENLVERIFGPRGSDEFQLGLDFPAWILQNPGLKPVIAPFIMSRNRGVGKSLYLSILTHIFGYSKQGDLQARQFKVEEIGTRFFNPGGCSLLMFDEVQFPVHRNMRQESANFWKHLKSLVTLDTIPVEYKGGDTVQMPNFAGIIMSGNTGNNFPIEEFDRRIWLIDNDPREMPEGVMDEFYDISKNIMPRETKRQILNSLICSLTDHSIRLPLDRMRAPMNEVKREMFLSTLSDLEEWWITYFEDRTNLLSRTPVVSKSAIIYLINQAERLAHTKWREDPEGTFREIKRRGLIQPIRMQGDNYQTRQFTAVPHIGPDGSVGQMLEAKTVMYTSHAHGSLNEESSEVVKQMYLANINQISAWKKEQTKLRGTKILDSMQS